MKLKKMISAAVAMCMTATTIVCHMASAMTTTAMEYGRAYMCYTYATGATNTYVLDGRATITGNDPVVCSVPDTRKKDGENTAVVRLSTGTGFIVDDHLIATAAHCLYTRDDDENIHQFVSNMQVEIYEGENFATPVATFTPVAAHICYAYTNDSAQFHYDYGLLYVAEDLSQYGAFDMGVPTDGLMDSRTSVTVSGFPDEVNGMSVENGRYFADGAILNINETDIEDTNAFPYQIAYETPMSSGQSGGPVYVTRSFQNVSYKTVIGINTSGYSATYGQNFGTRITSDILNFYYNNAYIDWYSA